MTFKLDNVCIFEPEHDILESIEDMQEQMGDEVTALITSDTYFKIRDYFSDRVKDYDVDYPDHYMSITRFENANGIIDFMVIGEYYEKLR